MRTKPHPLVLKIKSSFKQQIPALAYRTNTA